MDLFKNQKLQWIEEARNRAHQLLKKQYSITIEDVLREHPLPKFLHRNTIGAVMNQSEFKKIGYEPARKASSRGHIIAVWTEKLASDAESEPDFELPRYKRMLRKDYLEVQE